VSRVIDQIYLNIGQGIANVISDDWREAYIFVEMFEDAANLKGEYFSDRDKKYFEVDDEAFDDFEEIHAIMTQGDSNKWNRAKFTLYPTGKFNIDFEWDQLLADEVNSNS
jgi:hypothetical protein